MGTKLEIKNQI